MDFLAVLDQVIALLRQRGRLTYRTLQRQFHLDDAALEDLTVELIKGQRLAADEDGEVLVWIGDAASAPAAAMPAPAPLTYTPSYLAEKILTSKSALEGERKQVTVLFADLKGSMELLADRDPEEARQLLDPVLERMMVAVHRYEGTVNQVMGDGIMALFGAPIAHEDHAVRACYAALAMQEAIRGYSAEVRRVHGIEVQIRVGLNAGEVVVRAIGNDLHMDYSAIGQTTHLAARMEQLAPPGSIRLTADTLRLAEGWVLATPLGPVPVKGLRAPVEVFALVDASPVHTPLQAFAARVLTPFVGRQAELVVLHQTLEHAGAGHGQVVAVLGEPGVGKTRLVHEFTRASSMQGWRLLTSSATSYGKGSPSLPVIDLLKTYLQVEDRDDTRHIREKLTGRLLTLDAALGPTLPAFLALLAVPVEDPAWHALEPAQRRQRTLDALKGLLLRESQVQPLLLVLENLHWMDAETQGFLDGLVESLPAARLLLVVTYRPEYQNSWGQKTYYTQLRLDPLPPAGAEAVLQSLLGDEAGLGPLKARVITQTQGNPFFLEESVRTLVETQGLVGVPGSYRLAQALPHIQVPATVLAVLAARIDRLPPDEKRLLQTAAVIGTEVPLPLLQAIADLPEAVLHRGLAHLQAAEFLYETHLFPEPEYTFTHALTHEVAYGSLLLERRRGLHARLVEALEALAPDRMAEQVDRLAHHALRGEVWAKALVYCRQAGEKAMARPAYREAVGYFEQALSALAHLPETRETREQGIDLRFDLRHAFFALGEYERILDYLHSAVTLAEALGDQRRLGQSALYMAQYCSATGDHDRAIVSGQQAIAIGTTLADVAIQVLAYQEVGVASWALGAYSRAVEFLNKSIASRKGDLGRLSPIASLLYLGLCLAALGEFAEGIIRAEEAVRLAEAVENPLSLTSAYRVVGSIYLNRGELDRAIATLQRGQELCLVAHVRVWLPPIMAALGYAHALSGHIAEAIPLLEQAVEQDTTWRGGGYVHGVAWLGETYLWASRREEALTLATRALELSHTRKERGNEAWTLRLLGEIAMRCDPPEVVRAEAYYQQALALAEELDMRPLVARCHHGLGTLYATTGQQEQTRAALTTAIEMYRAMDMMFWLPETAATLAQVDVR